MLPSLRRRLPPLAGRAQRKPSRSFDFNQVNLERLAIEGLARYVPRMPSALEALLGSLRARRRLCYRSYERRRHHVIWQPFAQEELQRTFVKHFPMRWDEVSHKALFTPRVLSGHDDGFSDLSAAKQRQLAASADVD